MNAQSLLRVVNYMTASTVLIVGAVFLSGYLVPGYVPSNFRIIMGSVMILYGIYRLVMTRMKEQRERRDYDS